MKKTNNNNVDFIIYTWRSNNLLSVIAEKAFNLLVKAPYWDNYIYYKALLSNSLSKNVSVSYRSHFK